MWEIPGNPPLLEKNMSANLCPDTHRPAAGTCQFFPFCSLLHPGIPPPSHGTVSSIMMICFSLFAQITKSGLEVVDNIVSGKWSCLPGSTIISHSLADCSYEDFDVFFLDFCSSLTKAMPWNGYESCNLLFNGWFYLSKCLFDRQSGPLYTR